MTTVNIYEMEQTWNDGATAFTAIKMDVTNTASASGSRLLDLLVGGSPYFRVGVSRAYQLFNAGDETNGEWAGGRWVSNVFRIGAENAGTGSPRNTEIFTSVHSRIELATNNNITIGRAGFGPIIVNTASFRTDIQSSSIYMVNLPTSDPAQAGQLWNNSGVLTVSAG